MHQESATANSSPQQGYMTQQGRTSGGYGQSATWGGSPQKQTNLFYGSSHHAPSPTSSQRPPLPNRPHHSGHHQQGFGTSPNQYQQQHSYQTYQHQMHHQNHMFPQHHQSDFYHDPQNMIHLPAEAPRGNYGSHLPDQNYPGSEVTMKAAKDYLHKTYVEREKEEEKEKSEKKSEAEDTTEPGSEMICDLVLQEDKQLLTDYFYHVMMQLRPCRFTEKDRKTRGGKRENIKVGYPGLMCVHCMKNPNSRKFFWSNVDRLANSFAEIPGHVLKCRRCPVQTKQALHELKQGHADQMSQLPRGSQKVFFRRMWRRLHVDKENAPKENTNVEEGEEKESSDVTAEANKSDSEAANIPSIRASSSGSTAPLVAEANSEDTETRSSPATLNVGMSTKETARVLADEARNASTSASPIPLAIDEDKEWISDIDCFIRENVEVFCAKVCDVEKAQSERKYPITVGQVGVRCLHCAAVKEVGEIPQGTAVSYPHSVSGIYESVREFQRIHMESCPSMPKERKNKLDSLKGPGSLSSVLRRYYVMAAQALGLHDTNDGIRASGVSVCATDPQSVATSRSNTMDAAGDALNEAIRLTEQSNMSFIRSSPIPKTLGGQK